MAGSVSKTFIFDIETNGLLLDVSKFWVGVVYWKEKKKFEVFRDAKEMVEYLSTGDVLVGHNSIGYDIPALYKLTGINLYDSGCTFIDTLLLAKLIDYDKDGWSYSLDAYGKRLGVYKGSYDDWSKYTKEMEEYCIQDVKVTDTLYTHLKRRAKWLPKEALEIEQNVQKILAEQYLSGWEFDTSKARVLHIELVEEKEKAEQELYKTFSPRLIPKGKPVTPKKPFRRLGVSTVGVHQPIVLTEFNPGSGAHVVFWVERVLGKQNWLLTDKGNPKTDAKTLELMFSDEPFIKPLLHYLEVNKLLGQLAEGPKAWLKLEREGKLHHSVDLLGTVTGRATHSNPNLAQVPSVKKYKGIEARALFKPSKGWVQVGCDLSGVELRCLAHYMCPHDKGEYAKEILEGDIHVVNQEAAGLPTRDNAKTFIYGFLYGAGDAKIGLIVGGDAKIGRRLKTKFLKGLPALKTLRDGVAKAAKRGYLIGITGRRLHVRSPHAALNVLLQSLGSYISKEWMLVAHKHIKEERIRCNQLGWIHDELQFEVHPDDADKLMQILEASSLKAGENLGIRMPIHSEAKKGANWAECH